MAYTQTNENYASGQLSCIIRIIYTWWRHQMETFSALLVHWAGNSLVTGEFPSQKPMTRSFGVLFDLRRTKGWVNHRDAGDLRPCCAHDDVTVMFLWDWIALGECDFIYHFTCCYVAKLNILFTQNTVIIVSISQPRLRGNLYFNDHKYKNTIRLI